MNNIKYQGNFGLGLPLIGIYIWIFRMLLNINIVWIDVLAFILIFVGILMLISWDGES